jgi:hypothetical protein
MPMIATTIISSIRVKPCCFCIVILPGESVEKIGQAIAPVPTYMQPPCQVGEIASSH